VNQAKTITTANASDSLKTIHLQNHIPCKSVRMDNTDIAIFINATEQPSLGYVIMMYN